MNATRGGCPAQGRSLVTDWLHCRAHQINRTNHIKRVLEFDTFAPPAYC